MKRRKLIIDTDPGVDDAFAIITALSSSQFEVKGITTVAGNKSLEYVTVNAMKLIRLMRADCKVYPGSIASLKDLESATGELKDAGNTHGSDGLGDVDLSFDEATRSDTHAVDFIIDTVRQNPGKVEILAIGPVTNIALAIRKEPEVMKTVKTIWSMGGGVHRGNMTPVSEFNYWFDPEAVEVMYGIGTDVDIYMFGLDVTYNTFFTMNDLFFLRQEGGEIGRIMYDMTLAYAGSYWSNRRITGAVIHDLVPIIYAIDPGISKPEDVYRSALTVCCEPGLTQGQTIVDLVDRFNFTKNAYVVMNADSRRFKELFIEIVFGDVVDLYRKFVRS